MERPYLQPVYDEPEFIVRTIWRLYGGWWDGNPATLKPAPERTLARELADLAGGAAVLADRALALVGGATPAALAGGTGHSDDLLRLAGHLAELAWLAVPDDPAIGEIHRTVFTRRADAATSTMAKGVFSWAARGRKRRTSGRGPLDRSDRGPEQRCEQGRLLAARQRRSQLQFWCPCPLVSSP